MHQRVVLNVQRHHFLSWCSNPHFMKDSNFIFSLGTRSFTFWLLDLLCLLWWSVLLKICPEKKDLFVKKKTKNLRLWIKNQHQIIYGNKCITQPLICKTACFILQDMHIDTCDHRYKNLSAEHGKHFNFLILDKWRMNRFVVFLKSSSRHESDLVIL